MSRRSCAFYSKATTDFEYPVPLRLGRAVGRGRPHGLRPDPAPEALRQVHGVPATRRPTRNTSPTVIEPSLGADRVVLAFLVRRLRREQELEGGDVRTCAAPASGPGALQGGGAPPAEEQAGRPGAPRCTTAARSTSPWSTTRPAPSASATAVRTRSARPSASRVDFDTEADRQTRYRPRPRHHGAGARGHCGSAQLH